MAPKPAKAGEVYDDQGRRRFHGAFTGGFSAGYYNTVGTAEGWTPSTFTSSKSSRSTAKQSINDFMDEEDGVVGKPVQAKAEFNHEGAAKAMKVTAQSSKGQSIPGPIPHEFIAASINDPVGKKLLRTLGWREHSNKPKFNPTSTPIPPAKHDNYGIAFDAFKNAPEFEAARAKRETFETERHRQTSVYRMSDLQRQPGSSTSTALTTNNATAKSMGNFSLFSSHGDDESIYNNTSTEGYNNTMFVASDSEDEDIKAPVARQERQDEFKDTLEEYVGSTKPGEVETTKDGRKVLDGFVLIKDDDATDSMQKRWPGPVPPMAWNEGHVFKDDEVGTTLKQKLAVQNAIAEAGVGKTKMVVGEQGTVASELIAGLMKNRFTAATGVVEEQVLQVTAVAARDRLIVSATVPWIPPPLLCRRMDIKLSKEQKILYQQQQQQQLEERGAMGGSDAFFEALQQVKKGEEKKEEVKKGEVKKAAVEARAVEEVKEKIVLKSVEERPPMDLFKSIFEDGDDSDDSDSDEEEAAGGGGEKGAPKLLFRSSKRKKREEHDDEDDEEDDDDDDSTAEEEGAKKRKKGEKKARKKQKKERKKERKKEKKQLKKEKTEKRARIGSID